ncbi:hypothetical protein J2S74_002051 [Evansella vedderi]|uniref:Uncharacterized protein n=1 Tax=Evansella vedderi TaxID=38282 RepID=A0ABT9ZTV0_9BACI|nr:hypothetical protein [Evansella vedderi]MDQ0254672.1 hypothetical protein [Evansella vedderi]
MINLGDQVFVNKTHYSSYVEKGLVEGICQTPVDLQKYFNEDHPFYSTYFSWITNNKTIYVVHLENNIGRAGFLGKELSIVEK